MVDMELLLHPILDQNLPPEAPSRVSYTPECQSISSAPTANEVEKILDRKAGIGKREERVKKSRTEACCVVF